MTVHANGNGNGAAELPLNRAAEVKDVSVDAELSSERTPIHSDCRATQPLSPNTDVACSCLMPCRT